MREKNRADILGGESKKITSFARPING